MRNVSSPDSDSSEAPTALGIPIYVPAKQEVAVVVNGEPVYFPDQQPYIDQAGRIMIPMRFVSEAWQLVDGLTAWKIAACKALKEIESVVSE